jgi:hypothetical protein
MSKRAIIRAKLSTPAKCGVSFDVEKGEFLTIFGSFSQCAGGKHPS